MISRRQLMKAGLLGTAALPMLLPRKARAAIADVDVIVIGAGIAGLAAAQRLVELGYETIVLEADSVPGGRIKTDWTLEAPFEVGAGWIHGPDGNPISDLAEAVDAKPFVTDDDSYRVFAANGDPVSVSDIDAGNKRLEKLYAAIDDELDNDMALSKAIARMGGKLKSDPVVNWMTSAYTEFSTGGPIDKLSGYYFDEDGVYPGDDVILTQGYDTIIRQMAGPLDIRLNTRVSAIAYEKGEGAVVSTDAGDFESSFVICTVPLGVLKSGDIRFDPPLPKGHRRSIEKIGMGNVTKLALKFDKAYWPADVQYFGLMTETRGRWNYFLNYRTFSEENILLGLCFGSYAQTAEAMSDDEMVADCMDAVRTMFGGDVPEPSGHLATRWSKNPNSRGAYSYSSVGSQPKHFDDLAAPVADTILLAGEHTNFEYHATVHGAYQSGRNAAQIIEDRLAD
ncbi:NAD(P)/FAD-dependent oxidoreductase [Hoeflea sp. AS60]|uniref:flavin monoamine oxidase family protein n=1 Tax=Hoeflea sp. AS60 TaxID=3135780 RepID=UPI00316B60F6